LRRILTESQQQRANTRAKHYRCSMILLDSFRHELDMEMLSMVQWQVYLNSKKQGRVMM
jgi:hypothetical protein